MDKIKVTTKVYRKIEEWTKAGRTVNSFVCQDLSCLTNFFSPNPESCCPNHAWGCPARIDRADVKMADLEVEPVIAEPVDVEDISCYWRESNQMSIVIELPGHWRPIKVVSFGYLFEMDQATHDAILEEHGRETPDKWLAAAKESGDLEEIVNKFGFTLEKGPKALEV